MEGLGKEAWLVLYLVAFLTVFWNPLDFISQTLWRTQWFLAQRANVNKNVGFSLIPPQPVFRWVWTILFMALAASWFLFFQGETGVKRAEYNAGQTLYGAILILTKYWTLTLFRDCSNTWAFVVATLLWLVCVAQLIVLGVAEAWPSFGLLMPLALWATWAEVMSWGLWRHRLTETQCQQLRTVLQNKVDAERDFRLKLLFLNSPNQQ